MADRSMSVALMDARSIAATALNGGLLTPATEVADVLAPVSYVCSINKSMTIYQGFGNPQPEEELVFGPNITNWPVIRSLPDNLLPKVASVIYDPVTTTDELILQAKCHHSAPILINWLSSL